MTSLTTGRNSGSDASARSPMPVAGSPDGGGRRRGWSSGDRLGRNATLGRCAVEQRSWLRSPRTWTPQRRRPRDPLCRHSSSSFARRCDELSGSEPGAAVQGVAQLGPAVVDPRLDGADGDAEQLGDVGVLELAEVAQEDRLDETLVELLGGVEHVDARPGDDARRGTTGGEIGRRFEHAAAPLQLAIGVDRRVGRQLVHPGRELRASLERADPPGHGEQGVLGGLLGVEWVGQEPPAATEDQRAGRDEQLVEGGRDRRSLPAADASISSKSTSLRSVVSRTVATARSPSPRFGRSARRPDDWTLPTGACPGHRLVRHRLAGLRRRARPQGGRQDPRRQLEPGQRRAPSLPRRGAGAADGREPADRPWLPHRRDAQRPAVSGHGLCRPGHDRRPDRRNAAARVGRSMPGRRSASPRRSPMPSSTSMPAGTCTATSSRPMCSSARRRRGATSPGWPPTRPSCSATSGSPAGSTCRR